MKQPTKKQNNSKKILFIALIILISIISIIMLAKTGKNNKINNINQMAMGQHETTVGETTLDITNQVAVKPNKPKVSAGMIPIKWNGENWQITTKDDTNWYNYANGKMACMMLNDGVYQSELQADMTNKKLAKEGIVLKEEEMGTIFTWVPRFAYNSENNNKIYLKENSGVAVEYTTPEMFTYKASGVNKQDIALPGVWVEQKSGLQNKVSATTLNLEENGYGLIGNTKAETLAPNTDAMNCINIINSEADTTGIKNLTSSKIILKVVDEKQTEPIMAKLSAKGKKVTIEIIKGDVTRVISITEDGKEAIKENGKFTHKVETGGLNRFVLIDNLGNQRIYEINVFSPEIYVSSNQDNFVEFNGEKWYPSGTQVVIKFADDMSGKTGYYQEINGTTNLLKTTGNPSPWVNRGTYSTMGFTLTETMTYKAKIENSLGEVLGEDEATIHIMPTQTSIPSNYYNYNIGGIYPVKVTWYSGTSSPYGTETYLQSTHIRDAARHMGLIKQGDADKVLFIKIVPTPQGGYIRSTRNGVSTNNYTYSYNGYIFVTEKGEEIRLPKINNLELTEEENKIKVKVDAKSTNPGAEIVKYYYIMDNADTITDFSTNILTKYTESESNEFTFEDVKPYQNHTIRVIVQDNYGEVGVLSEIYEETVKTANGLQKPTITILKPSKDEEFEENDPEIVEYDGKTWYPAGTRIKVTYSESLTNTEMSNLQLKGLYERIYDTTGEVYSYNTGTSAIYTHALTESATWKFKLQDNTGEESEEVSVHLNIMPYEYYNTYTLPTNYINNAGAIYPVRVTGDSSIRTTEWKSRHNRNRYIYI